MSGTIWRESRATARGDILIMTLVFVTMFVVIFTSLAGLTGRQHRQTVLQAQDELAFQVAEAGLNYGRWRLAHDPEDFTAATRDVEDQLAGVIGSYDVTFEPPVEGGTIVEIVSTGHTGSQPNREVTLRARYGIPSLARYASIVNEDVWYSGQIKGYVHANGGIRMDGQSDSLVASARETYTCQPHHGCNYEEKPGVWGTGTIQELWEYPVPPVDYGSLTLNLLDMKEAAQANNTYYGSSDAFGYHLTFNANNTYTVQRVTKKGPSVWSFFPETDWQYTSYDIGQQKNVHTKPVPAGGVIFFEDTVWVEGTIRDRVTVAAGVFPDSPATNVDVIVNGDISYGGVKDGSRSFGAIAQRHVLIPYSGAKNVMQLDGAFIAQKGRFGRHHYTSGSHRLKTSLTRYGMIASNLVPVTAWVNDSGQVTSGYQSGQAEYDPNLLYAPPPYFPTTGQYQFISWEEVE